MTAEYPKDKQNPPYDEGERLAEQGAPRVKVPDEKTARRDAPSNSGDPAHLEDYPSDQGHRENQREVRGT